jgi:heme-degrading monooxygenase HmoA
MVVIVFRSRLRAGAGTDEGLMAVGARMYELASAMPGFASYKDFNAEDGEAVTIVEFDTLEHLAAWRTHPEHKEVQQRGRERYFSEYHIQVCTTVRDYNFKRES